MVLSDCNSGVVSTSVIEIFCLKCLLYAKHSAKHFIQIISFNPYKSLQCNYCFAHFTMLTLKFRTEIK